MVRKNKNERKISQVIKAVELRHIREVEADILKHDQECLASDLSNILNADAHPPTQHIHEQAAAALKASQIEAAAALKISQAADAKLLKKSQQSHAEELKEKNQVISWVMGSYSVDPTKDE